jgi:hypothetical protein
MQEMGDTHDTPVNAPKEFPLGVCSVVSVQVPPDNVSTRGVPS